MATRLRRTLRLSLLLASVLVLASACSGSDHASSARGTETVTERDFHIAAPAGLAAGEVTLTVHNEGPDAHELIVVRADRARLPLRSDGLTVDEEGLGKVIVGALEPGSTAGHYLGGMHTTMVVS